MTLSEEYSRYVEGRNRLAAFHSWDMAARRNVNRDKRKPPVQQTKLSSFVEDVVREKRVLEKVCGGLNKHG